MKVLLDSLVVEADCNAELAIVMGGGSIGLEWTGSVVISDTGCIGPSSNTNVITLVSQQKNKQVKRKC